jgi:hypothetical protein
MSLQGIQLTTWLLLMPLLHPIPVFAQVYKWVDQNGRIQYGDMPPLGKADPELLRASPNQERNQPARPASNWEDSEREFQKRRIQKQMQAEKENPPISAAQLCGNARDKLQMLDGRVVYRVNEKGERIYMNDEERSAIETKAKQDMAKYCLR